MPQVDPAIETFARIKVVGVGGAGGAAVNRMVDAGVSGVDFVAINTDAQALHHSKAAQKLHIGKDTSKGLGAGADPTVGQNAAEESESQIAELLKGSDMVFVNIGAGGGTGSGAGPIVAKLAKDTGALVVGFATRPFAFEGDKRRRNAEIAIEKLRKNVDTLITVPNDKLLSTIDRRTPLLEAFKVADDVLRQGVQGISDLITVHGLINLDFADVKTVMANAGTALMGIGRASGENRAIEAATQAISSPLLEVSIDGARGILFNVIGGQDMSMHEINTVAETITAAADAEANIIFGATVNPEIEGEIIVTVVATGFDDSYYATRQAKAAQLLRQSDELHVPTGPSQVDEATMAGLDMELKEDESQNVGIEDFHKEDTTNIWALPDDDEENNAHEEHSQEENELDKPSFLRRFKRSRPTQTEQSEPVEEKDEVEVEEAEPEDEETERPKEPEEKNEKTVEEQPKDSKSKKSKS